MGSTVCWSGERDKFQPVPITEHFDFKAENAYTIDEIKALRVKSKNRSGSKSPEKPENKYISIEANNYFKFDLGIKDSNSYYRKLFSKALPKFDQIDAVRIQDNPLQWNNYCTNAIPKGITCSRIDSKSEEYPKFSSFIAPLKRIAFWIREELWIIKFTLDRDDIKKIVDTFYHIKKIIFHDCQLHSLDLGITFRYYLT